MTRWQGVDFHPYPLISQESKMEFDRKSAHFGAFSALLEQNLEKVKSGAKWKSTPCQLVVSGQARRIENP